MRLKYPWIPCVTTTLSPAPKKKETIRMGVDVAHEYVGYGGAVNPQVRLLAETVLIMAQMLRDIPR